MPEETIKYAVVLEPTAKSWTHKIVGTPKEANEEKEEIEKLLRRCIRVKIEPFRD